MQKLAKDQKAGNEKSERNIQICFSKKTITLEHQFKEHFRKLDEEQISTILHINPPTSVWEIKIIPRSFSIYRKTFTEDFRENESLRDPQWLR